jgi:hypothetical protein
MKETTDASQARMLAKMDEIIEDMRAWWEGMKPDREATGTCLEKVEACQDNKEPNQEEMQYGAEHREVLK